MAEKREEIQKLFSKELRENEKLRRLQKKVESGKATYREAEKFAAEVGKAYANSFQSVVGNAEKIGGDQYFEVAKEVFPPGLHSIYSETAAYVEQVQKLQNEEAGIGLKPLVPDYSDVYSDYLRKLQGTVTESAMDHVIASESEFYAQQVVDRALEMNAEAQQNAGLEVSVTRIYDGVGVHNRKDPCEWCLSRCGENMTLQEAKSKDAFRRHPGCGCTIVYKSAKGETTVRVGGGGWINAEEYAKIEARKTFGLDAEQNAMDYGLRSSLNNGTIIQPHDPPEFIKTIDFNDLDQINRIVEGFERDSIDSRIETAIVILPDGNVYKCFGIKDAVYPDADLGERIRGAVISHNHPQESTEYSFSDADRILYNKYNLLYLRGKDHKFTYQIDGNTSDVDKMPDDTWNFINFRHSIMIRDAKKLGFGYRRWAND